MSQITTTNSANNISEISTGASENGTNLNTYLIVGRINYYPIGVGGHSSYKSVKITTTDELSAIRQANKYFNRSFMGAAISHIIKTSAKVSFAKYSKIAVDLGILPKIQLYNLNGDKLN